MVLRLDPRLPLVWRSPSSLQLGIDRAAVVLENVSEAQERMIAALITGTGRPALDVLAGQAGADSDTVELLLRAVRAALVSEPPQAEPRIVTLAGRGPTLEQIADALASSGVQPRLVGNDVAAAAEGSDFAVVVAHFVIDPEFHGVWLRRDLPHLPVVFGDAGARIGPIVEPGVGPCLYCLERTRSDADPAWPAIASQLWGRRSPIDRGLVSYEVAGRATRLVLARLDGGAADAATSVYSDAATGSSLSTTWTRHPQCGCGVLPGSATADEERNAAAPPRPRTGAGAGAPG